MAPRTLEALRKPRELILGRRSDNIFMGTPFVQNQPSGVYAESAFGNLCRIGPCFPGPLEPDAGYFLSQAARNLSESRKLSL